MNVKGDEERELYRAMFYMMHIAFVEIRAAESLNATKKFADIFHNLPSMLLDSSSADEDLEVYRNLLEKAKRYNMERYIESLKLKALKPLSGK